jgi:hypothetical protein
MRGFDPWRERAQRPLGGHDFGLKPAEGVAASRSEGHRKQRGSVRSKRADAVLRRFDDEGAA